ncbi:DNA/RNA helicase domain-containing protein [Pedobacter sp. GR22-6]|uniref:DNA/RNA helicase domain-containing protein n=1 Tax=Pedobacter sp. GR22-6 TaxID=3127957 RepID=UPI00307EF1F0
MSLSFDLSVEVSEQYDFSKQALSTIDQNTWVKNQWPLLYFLQNDQKKIAYVGESTNAASRVRNHLTNPKKSTIFNKISIIGSDKFNKSATLDIESNLIQYITAEGTYELENGNFGLINHNYYQQDLYRNLFKEIWTKLMAKKVVSKSLHDIENSELFKFSPYKALNEDQYNSVIEILEGLTEGKSQRIFVQGGAGTGKTVLATYIIKLLCSKIQSDDLDEYNEDELKEIRYILAFQKRYPNAKIGLVIAMTSLRETLENVFSKIPGLKSSMIINPSGTFKKEKYDLLIVDEAHRLRQFKNISWMGAFQKNNQKLGLDDNGTELDWILANSKNQIFFYDADQSVKPSDVKAENFRLLIDDESTLRLELKSQMRVKGGKNYIEFVDQLLHVSRKTTEKFESSDYELYVFDSLKELYKELSKKEEKYGLCRLVAGYAWPWASKPIENRDAIDIEIEDMKFQWNQTDEDWINSPNAFNEIGCIHTTQGYDLNYTGVIFGREISYNKALNRIEVDPKLYFDRNGKAGANAEDLKGYIINIYKTIMYRGIRGTFIYACNEDLREYLKNHIVSHQPKLPFRILKDEEIKPYVNCVPLIDISVAAGDFSDLQGHSDLNWIELPMTISVKPGYFVCKVVGESMNKKIPNGAYCLFREDPGGSREGKIVLVQSTNIHDADFGSGYTVKEYHSEKKNNNEEWTHKAINLRPLSYSADYNAIELTENELTSFKVMGIFDQVLI